MIKAILFEIDFTLFDAGPFYDDAFRSICADLGKRHGRDGDALFQGLWEIRDEIGCRHPRFLERFLDHVGIGRDEESTIRDMIRRRPIEEGLYEDATRFLEQISDDIRLGIITDGDPMLQRNKVRALDLTERFDPIIFTGDFGGAWSKPSPLPFRSALKSLSLEPRDVLYVADDPHLDAVGPGRIGMAAVRVLRGDFRDHPSPAGWTFQAEISRLTGLLVEGFLDPCLSLC